MRGRRLLVLPILGLLLTACGLSSFGHASAGEDVEPACCPPPQDAKVAGVLVGIGGPVWTATQHWAGTIRVRGTQVTTIHTDARGHFTAALAAGTYRLTATSPSYDGGRGTCSALGSIRLRSHHTTHVRVVCQMK